MLHVLDNYCRALAGRQVTVASCEKLVDKNLGWARTQLPTCDGTTIYLPPNLPDELQASELPGFAWYKVMATHQVGQLEWGSFDFQYARAYPQGHANPELPTSDPALADYARFFARFPQPRLARDLFAITEAFRIDCRVLDNYPGLAPTYQRAREHCLAERVQLVRASAQESFVEWALRASLGQPASVVAPAIHVRVAEQASQVLAQLRAAHSSVEAAAHVATELYRLAAPTADVAAFAHYRSPVGVFYRGAFKPELARLFRDAHDSENLRPPERPNNLERRKQLQELVRHSHEAETPDSELPEEIAQQALVENLEDALSQRAPPPPPGHDSGGSDEDQDNNDALEATDPGTFTYDEWDAGRQRYRKAFCLLHEATLVAADNDLYAATLRDHAALAERIRRHFEAIAAQLDRKQMRLHDGDDLDLDAVVEAVVDRKCGHTPSDKLFFRRNKQERDVAVAFLLDMSSSTGDPVDRKADRYATGTQRLIDVERQSLVLLAHALQALGDPYGIYGFSGYGRKRVELHVIKELNEPLSANVKQRIGAIEPQSATRMGPAIRHTTQKLLAHPARHRYLFLLSDGRPQDQGYGDHAASQLYAVHDTRMALLDAHRRGITPFCLAIDKSGHDYLGTMMQDLRYEVLWDVAMLPERLPDLYRALTT
ncbi:MAG TPA: hypothetical protein VF331_00140 [Polyangiales bacterium]